MDILWIYLGYILFMQVIDVKCCEGVTLQGETYQNIPKVKLGQAIIWENLSPVCKDPNNVMPESQLEYQTEQSSWLEPAWLTMGQPSSCNWP